MNEFTIVNLVNKVNFHCDTSMPCEGVTEYHYNLIYDESVCSQINMIPRISTTEDSCICLHIEKKALGVAGIWTPHFGFKRNLTGDWAFPQLINLSHSAPVICFFDYSGQNCFTVTLSEVSRDVQYVAGVHEETGCLHVNLLLSIPRSTDARQLSCRIDCRRLPFHTVVIEAAGWWDTLLADAPMPTPEIARLPMYSTWYSYHQDISDDSLYREYQQAAEMGMRAVIIDDGWQTTDNHRGYGFCGDWTPATPKFPDFRSHVQKIHSLGMKCLIWYSVPFVGEYSGIWPHFKDMLLSFDSTLHAGILDPRYPKVREYLIATYEKAIVEWDLDGLKLDFIDSFRMYPETPAYHDGMDFQEIQDAVYCLMIGIFRHLNKIKPELLIEFRQTYIGPQMRRFGNILRVGDCPLSGITNRVGIADLKLTSGSTAIHSDMLMWHTEETPENIAIQLINCIFATLQISVKLNTLSPRQRKVLEHYLNFSIQYRDVLQLGDFAPQNPLALYPTICSKKDQTCIIAVYDADRIVKLPQEETLTEYWILNGCLESSLILSASKEEHYHVSVYDCMGECMEKTELTLSGISTIDVPAGGSVLLKKDS